jgi:hypothetical protein
MSQVIRSASGCGGVRAVLLQGEPDRVLATAGEHQGVPRQLVDYLVQVVARAARLLPAKVRRGERPGQAPVAGQAAGAGPAGAGRAGPGSARRRPRCAANLLGGFGDAHHPVEAVVVGQREGADAHPGGLLGQFLRVAGAVEDAEVGVAVRVRKGGELKLVTLPDAVAAGLDSPVERRQ